MPDRSDVKIRAVTITVDTIIDPTESSEKMIHDYGVPPDSNVGMRIQLYRGSPTLFGLLSIVIPATAGIQK